MNATLRKPALPEAVAMLLATALVIGSAGVCAADEKAAVAKPATSVPKWSKVDVELPLSEALFPPGDGADVANGQCLLCHSVGMVLHQPPLTQEEWTAVIQKMRNSYGAPLPAQQVDALAKYLHSINSKQSAESPAVASKQGD